MYLEIKMLRSHVFFLLVIITFLGCNEPKTNPTQHSVKNFDFSNYTNFMGALTYFSKDENLKVIVVLGNEQTFIIDEVNTFWYRTSRMRFRLNGEKFKLLDDTDTSKYKIIDYDIEFLNAGTIKLDAKIQWYYTDFNDQTPNSKMELKSYSRLLFLVES